MKMNPILLYLVSFIFIFAISLKVEARDYQVLLFAGYDIQTENNSEFNSWVQNFTLLGAGVKVQDWIFDFQIEHASLGNSSGGLNIQQNSNEYSFETLYSPVSPNYLLPYIGGSLGVLSESIDTQLLGAKSNDVGAPDYFFSANMGARINSEIFWVSAEMRLIFCERHDPNPALSWLGRIGFLF